MRWDRRCPLFGKGDVISQSITHRRKTWNRWCLFFAVSKRKTEPVMGMEVGTLEEGYAVPMSSKTTLMGAMMMMVTGLLVVVASW